MNYAEQQGQFCEDSPVEASFSILVCLMQRA